ncbi:MULTISPECIES: hypothetical protein [Brenneria]|uniref:Uncharacterized protein n=1 Tax=Brenneria nigrifluens DSM 30175 = ATCC 13028 TaxID=1121120 RepID=A0A2U1UNW1_9GAMM|nr:MULTISPECIES: hypothetical protein [Brenneria]EHD19641.1 hypothetical protein BrE312_0184 [Brenneria sp. EniD312]PWC23262.1 hypothetical protein DDT54_15595 [Brenneria nigrifluens DSM 30175 = ATCC 13028]QCR02905.1 hypothetical protein EH206_00925 [Brenneria nigrifluens DSM 30175 = ATCC 13028]
MTTLFLKRTGGGLNNQKMILLALIIEAIEQQSSITLPHFINFLAKKDTSTLSKKIYYSLIYKNFQRNIPIFDIFDRDSFFTFLRKYNVKVRNYHLFRFVSKRCNPSDLFFKGEAIINEFIDNEDYKYRELIIDFFKYLIPSAEMEKKINYFIAQSEPYDAVCQLRIESDWPLGIEDSWKNKSSTVASSPLERCRNIFIKIKNTLPDIGTMYVTYDKSAITCSFEEIVNLAQEEFSFRLKEKKSSAGEAMHPKNSLEASVVDFEIAVHKDIFIGTNISTFTLLSSITRVCRGLSDQNHRYLYNIPGDLLVLDKKIIPSVNKIR